MNSLIWFWRWYNHNRNIILFLNILSIWVKLLLEFVLLNFLFHELDLLGIKICEFLISVLCVDSRVVSWPSWMTSSWPKFAHESCLLSTEFNIVADLWAKVKTLLLALLNSKISSCISLVSSKQAVTTIGVSLCDVEWIDQHN